MNLVIKSGNDPAALIATVRHIVGSIDKDQPIFAIATMKQLVANSVSSRRMTLVLLGLFGTLALLLACVGIYGVISYSVAQRTHEIGIRMALGAQHRDVLRMIVGQGGRIAGAGVVIGVIISFGLVRFMTDLLFSVSAADPLTFGAVAILLALITMLACYIPARRAVRVDPMGALRHE
jgi:putative ABC transport system permease protein